MRVLSEIFKDEEPREFLQRIHPINGLAGFKLWHERVLGHQLKQFHADWASPLIEYRYQRVAIAAPTGFGKSELFGISYPLWRMWHNVTNHQDAWSGLIVSTSMPQSAKIINRIKDAISNNELLCELKTYDPLITWSSTEIKLKNGTSIACRPLNENVKSYHVDYVFADEVSSYTDKDCFYKYVSTRISSKKGQLAAVSTPESEGDLLLELQSKSDTYHSITTSAVTTRGESIWPERYPISYLMERKAEIGPKAFALQYLCDTSTPLDDLNSPFPFSLLLKNSDKDLSFEYEPDKEGVYFISYDPAFSFEGDYNVIILGKLKQDKIFISQIHRYKGDPDEAIAIIKGLNDKFRPQNIVVDTGGGGSKVLRDINKHNLPATSFSLDASNRVEAFRETITAFHSGKVILPLSEEDSRTKAMMEVFYNEMTHMMVERTPNKGLVTYKSHTRHDDVAMAFIMLVKTMAKTQDFVSYIRSDSRGITDYVDRRVNKDRELELAGVKRFKIL